MNLIIEGLDRTGKDTLIRNILKNFNRNYHVLHCQALRNEEESRSYYLNLFKLLHYNSKFNFILNRSHIGEMVYANLFRGYSGDYVLDFERKYSDVCNNSFLVVLVCSDIRSLWEREDGNSLGVLGVDGFKTLKESENSLFKDAFEKTNIQNKILIDIADKSINQVFEEFATSFNDWCLKLVLSE